MLWCNLNAITQLILVFLIEGVKIIIPKGAIAQGVDQEVYFKVCKDTNNITPLDKARGLFSISVLQFSYYLRLNVLNLIYRYVEDKC